MHYYIYCFIAFTIRYDAIIGCWRPAKKSAFLFDLLVYVENLSHKPLFLSLQLHSDVDSGDGNIKYILSGEGAGTIFVIDDKTGNIHATKTLDREEQAQYTLTAQAVARDTNKPLEPPSEFIVKVQDINDNPPEFLHGPYYARVAEMSNVGECEPLEKHICQLLLFLYEPTPDSLFLMNYLKELKSDSQKVSR